MQKKSIRNIVIAVTISFVVVTAITIYVLFDPAVSIFFPKCPSLLLTGYKCAGCGSQRAIHSLLHFDVVSAFFYNPILILYIPYLLFGSYMEYMGGKIKFYKIYGVFFGKTAIIINFTVIVVYTVLRNIINI